MWNVPRIFKGILPACFCKTRPISLCYKSSLYISWMEIHPVHPKGNQSWIFIGRTDAEAETPILGHLMRGNDSLERPWRWERLKVGGEGEKRGWDGWTASLTRRTWVWVNSKRWQWTGRPGVLQSMGSQRVGHGWATELIFPINTPGLKKWGYWRRPIQTFTEQCIFKWNFRYR